MDAQRSLTSVLDHGTTLRASQKTCHGPVDRMPLMRQEASLQMEWCLECHREPERYVRPRAAVFSVDYVVPRNQLELGARLVAEYRIEKLTSCSTCHR